MANNSDYFSVLRSRGICRSCGRKIDDPSRFARCEECRRFSRAKQVLCDGGIPRIAIKISDEELERARYAKMLKLCEGCAFATYVGSGSWFCPLPVCRYNDKKPDGEPENPLGTTITEVIEC